MSQQSSLVLYEEEEEFNAGEETFIESVAGNNAVVFEDDGNTGYFYAALNASELHILDALHVYDVESVTDNNKPNNLKIFWNQEATRAFLVINGYCHAVFDFDRKAGYNRNAFPESGEWAEVKERKLTDALLQELVS